MTELETKQSQSGSRRSASVGMKIGLVVAFCLGTLLTVSGVSLWQMNIIGTEIEAIAERDIPLTTALTNITVHQLEQAVNFERAVGAAWRRQQDPRAAAIFKKSVEKFEALATKVDKEIKDAETLAEQAEHDAVTPEERQEFKHVAEALKKIEKGHKSYDEHAIQIFRLMAAGRQNETAQMIVKTVAEEEKLDHTLEELLTEIGTFTAKAAKTAEEHEHFAIKLLMAMSAIALLLGAAFAWLIISRSIALSTLR